ncbi:MAG: DUF642 domain-containing protein [Verrucomicrobiaceae bacterium]|nr:MAG: DUF642 domain-containing protein [Verrucomicrobiaceae bacterium]
MSLFLPIRRLLACAALAILPATAQPAHQALRAHPQNPHLLEFRGKPTVLRTFGEHYSSVVNAGFNYPAYLDVLERDRMNLTRVFLVAYRETPQTTPALTPLSVPPAQYVQPWQRSANHGNALDGLGKWDFSTWNEEYFTRLKAFVGACGEHGVVAELTLFCTYYTDNHWQASPFNPANNVQASGPANRYDCFRPGNAGLLPVQEAVVRRITRELNGYDNWYFSIQNEPFWNQPGVKDDEEVVFHDTVLGYIRDEESTLPNRHLVAHNFPQKAASFSGNYDVINEHYPAAVPGSTIAGAEALLRDHYSSNKLLSLDETDTPNPVTARLEAWMFTHGGGAIYNGLNFVNLVYTTENESGDTPIGNEQRATVRRLGTYLDNLELTGLRRDLSWITSGVPTGASQQSMSKAGQQYVAYLHHGKSGQYNFQLHYEPIDDAEQTAALTVSLPEGNWRVTWTRPADLTVLASQEFNHTGGSITLAPVSYREDVALRIDRAGAGDITPPPAPGDFTADASADGSIALGWRAVQAADLAGYRLHRAEAAGFTPDGGNLLAELPAADIAYRDASAALGTTFHYRLLAVDNQGNLSASSDEVLVTPEMRNRPYHGTPHPIPGAIQAEDFDLGGEGVAYSDTTPLNLGTSYRMEEAVDLEVTTDSNGAHHVSSLGGEWLEYTVNMEHAGGHALALRLSAAAAGGVVSFEIDGSPVSGGIAVPATGEGIWQTVTVPEAELPGGVRVLRLRIDSHATDGSAVLINWFSLTPVVRTGPTADAGVDREVVDADFNGEETVTLDGSGSVAGDGAIAAYEWTRGGNVIGTGISPVVTLPLGQHTVTLTVTDANGLQDTDELAISVTARGFVNGGFEKGYTGWSFSGNHSVQSGSPYVITEGTRLVAFNNNERTPNGVLSQTFSTVPGQLYVLSFDMGMLAYNNSQQKLQVQLAGAASLLNVTHTTNRLNNQLIRWETKNHPFTADSTSTTLTFRDLSTATNAVDLTLDNVRVVQQVTRTLTVSSSPGSAAVTLSPADTIGRTGGTTTLGRTYQNGTTVTLAAPANSGGLTFQKWRKNGTDLTTSPSTTVLMDADHELTAVYVAGPPVITGQPESAAVATGTTATFRVTAAATVSLSYQWRFMGSPLPGASSDTLVISDVQPTNTGSYDVVVTGSTGAVTSTAASLSVFSAGSLVNGSFEAGYTGWTVTGNQAIQTASLYTATDGTQLVAFNRGESPPNGVLSQSFATTPGQSYVLAFDMGVLAYNNSQQKLQVQVTGATPLVNQTHTTNRLNNQLIRWESKNHPFTADSTSTTLTFKDVSTATNALDLTLDNVRIIPQITRTLTIASDPASPVPVTVSPADTIGRTGGNATLTRTYQNLTAVTVTAPATSGGMVFQKWRKNGVDLATTAAVSVVMDGNHTLTAVYQPIVLRTLAVETTPVNGVNISVSPADTTAQGNGTSSFTRAYADGAAVTLTAPATISGHTFQKWQRNGADFASTASVSVTMDANHTLTAIYQPIVLRTLAVETTPVNGVNISVSPADTTAQGNGTSSFTRAYADGTAVTLTAPATISGHTFQKWQRNGADFASTASVSVTMDANHTLTAIYQPIILRTLAVETTPVNGVNISVSPADSTAQGSGISPFTRTHADGTTVALSAPATISGHVFQKWQRDGADLATTSTVSVVMDADRTLTAVYQPIVLHTLTVTSSDGSPAITLSPADDNGLAGGTVTFTRSYQEGNSVTLTTPASIPGFTFEKWQRDGADLATTPAVTVTMDADHTLHAVYQPVVMRSLSVSSTAGTPPFTVTPADSNGVTGGNGSATLLFPHSTTVTLSKPVTSGGYVFQKWQLNGADLTTSASASVLMDGDHTLTAVYEEGPPVIAQQPANVTTAAGTSASFSVAVTSVSTPSYQWRFNGGAIGGATSATLSIANVQAANAGTYDVVITTPGGSVTSNPATLTLPATGTLVNGSFENGYTGWTATGNQTVQTASFYTATDGTRLVSFNNGEVTPNGVLTQTFPTTPGQSYLLTFDMGVLAYNNSQQKLQVQLTGSTSLLNVTHTTNRINNQLIRWESKSHVFTANSTSTTLTFKDVSTATNALDLTLDNVRVIPQVNRTLTVTTSPAAGAVIGASPLDTSGQGGGTTSFTRTYSNTTTVTLTAPAFTSGRTFQKWQRNGTDLASSASVSVVMDADLTLTAIYVEGGPSIPSALKIMPLGDSITFGYDGNNAGYRGPLYNLLSPMVPGFQYIGTMALNPGSLPATPMDQRNHQGLSGYNILDVANNLDGLDTTRFVTLGGADRNPAGGYWLTGGNGTGRQPMYPDIITMMLGTNDLFNPTGMENRLRNLISKLTTLRPDTKLFVAKITPAPNFPAISVAYNEQVAAIVAEFRAAGKNVHLVDLHTGFPGNGMGSDGLHPNHTGFLWMAQRWYDAILASYPPIDPAGPPLVTDPPDTGSVNAGSSVTLKVTAQGAGTLSYQWRFNGTPISGATSATLELVNVQSTAAGTYDVVVSNSFGQVTSSPATLSVLVAAALANGSFEADLNNWTASGNVQSRPGTNPYSATDGAKIAAFNMSNSTPNGLLTQIVSTTPGVTYTLAFDVGVLSYNTSPQQLQVTVNGSASLLSRNVSVTGTTNGVTRWFPQTFTFTADAATATLAFRDISTATNALDLLLDNVRLTGGNAPAPAPAAAAPTPLPAPSRGIIGDLPPPAIGFASLTAAGGNHSITLNAVMSGRYFLERSSNLTDWEKVGEDIAIDSPALLEFPAPPPAADALSGGQPLFYRIGRRPDPPAD